MVLATKPDSWHISSIHLKAFKSFSQSASFALDSNGLVGIVGPNGSGKSNLLEAVCFATGCSTAVLRGCRTLKDVSSTDAAAKLPAVQLQFSRGSNSHLLETALSPEGTRQYRIDGRLKSGTQVKDFLHSLGIVVDSTTVIQQAAITRLTDSNNPSTLAGLVAAASGLDSWNEETAAARQEVLRTRRALKDIQVNISKVQAAVAADEAAVQASLTAARLESELEAVQEQLVAVLLQQQAGFEQQRCATQQHRAMLEVSKAAAAEQVEQLIQCKQQLATQQAQVLADLEASSCNSSSCSLVEDIAAAEAKLASLQAESAAHAAQTADILSCKQLLQQHHAKVQQLQNMLHIKREAAVQASSSLSAMQAASSGTDSARLQLLGVQKQVAAAAAVLAQQQAAVDVKQGQLQQTRAAVAAVQQQLRLLTNHQAPRPETAGMSGGDDACGEIEPTVLAAAASAAAAAADNHLQQVSALQQQVLQLQIDHEACSASSTQQHIAALLSHSSNSSGHLAPRPLHQCFTLKDAANPQHVSQVLVPLAIIAGPSVLQVLIVNSMHEANNLLAAAAASGGQSGAGGGRGGRSKLRIWPLDSLKASSFTQRQRAAQQDLGSGRVILPVDLLEYHPMYESAIVRAFGGYVIAVDDATAAELVQRFGLSSVTLQGTVSMKGSMSGGWAGNGKSYAQRYWTNKLKQDSLAGQLAEAQQHLAQETTMQQQLEAARHQAEAALTVAEQQQQLLQELQHLQADATAADALLRQEQQCLRDAQQQHTKLQQRQQQFKDMNRSSSEGLQPGGSSSSSKAAAAALQQQLKEDAKATAAEAKAAERQLQSAEDMVEQLSARLDTLEFQLHATSSAEQLQQQLQKQATKLQLLLQQHTTQQHAAQQLSDRHSQLQQQLQDVQQLLLQQQTQLRTLLTTVQRADADDAAAEKRLSKIHQDLNQLAKDFRQLDAVQGLPNRTATTAAAAAAETALSEPPGEEHASVDMLRGAGHSGPGTAGGQIPSTKEVQQLTRRAKRLQQEMLLLNVSDLPAAQKTYIAERERVLSHTELCESRVSQVQQFRQQAAALEAAAAALEQHITSCADQVYAANDVVFEGIVAGFTQLCSSLLPSLELQLHKTGQLAHEGLQFRFRRLEDTASTAATAGDQAAHTLPAPTGDGSSSNQGWHTSLSQLSGGQQTMVSLAMLLAVARSGNGSKLFLLDEIDAALDQHNQTRAAALLQQLAAGAGDGQRCQILCVTHNAAFQQVCDAFLQVARGPSGSSMSAAAAAGDQGVAGFSSMADATPKNRATSSNKKARTASKAIGKAVGKTSRAPNKKVRFVD